jgi:branched-chain amino acid transport system ATP-binding protein
MLKIEKLKSGYERQEIVHGVHLRVGHGEIVALVGLNGSGKSTILNSVFNFSEIYSGEIYYNNKKITTVPAYELAKKGLGYVPQGRQLFFDMTVKENLEMGAFIIDDGHLVEELIGRIFLRFPFLEKRKHDYAFTLSGGQQQILSLARALILKPKLLLLDEPFLGLSSLAVKEIVDEIKKINREGTSILMAEHNAKIVSSVANRIYVVKNGNIDGKN